MTSISKYVYIEKLHDIVNKYNNIYHGTIKMKPLDIKSLTLPKELALPKVKNSNVFQSQNLWKEVSKLS